MTDAAETLQSLGSRKKCSDTAGEAAPSAAKVSKVNLKLGSRYGHYPIQCWTRREALISRNLFGDPYGFDSGADLAVERIASKENLPAQHVPRPARITTSRRDEVFVQRLGGPTLHSELPEGPVDFEPVGRRAESCGGCVTAPPPLFRSGRESGADRIEDDVARELQQMRLSLNENSLEATLHQMPDPLVALIEPLRIDTVQVTHAAGQGGLRGVEEQVIVVAHQHERMDTPVESIGHPGEQPEKERSVLIVAKDLLALVAAAGYVPDGSPELEAKRSRHRTPYGLVVAGASSRGLRVDKVQT